MRILIVEDDLIIAKRLHMYILLGLLGMSDIFIFVTSYFGVLVVFVGAYLFFYWLTSRVYYNIINENSI